MRKNVLVCTLGGGDIVLGNTTVCSSCMNNNKIIF